MNTDIIQNFRTAIADFHVNKNDTFKQTVQFTDENSQPIDLSVYTFAKMQLKENENSESILQFTSTGITHYINLSGSTVGIISIGCTVPLSIPAFAYRYDLQFNNTTVYETISKGKFKVVQDITT